MFRNNDINQTHVGHRQSGKHAVNQSRLKKELTFIRAKVSSLQDNMQKALCVIPIITSQKEEEKLIQGCTRVRLCSSSNDRIINSFTLEMLGLNSRKKSYIATFCYCSFFCSSLQSSYSTIEAITNIPTPGKHHSPGFPDRFAWRFPVDSHIRVLFSESNSDDNLLKNIELFEKLSLSYNGRVLFIKDVIGDEICCWSFYGQGRKLAEVCCTSIVYATEKKQTKVV